MTATPTQILSPLAPPERMAFSSILLDNSMPAGGYTILPSWFGFTSLAVNKAGTGFVQPIVLSVSGAVAIARCVGSKLILSYPSGGATAAPASPADPAGGAITGLTATATPAAGATPVTSTGAQPAIPVTFGGTPATAMTPGVGKDFPTGADCSAITVNLVAVGH